MAIAKHLSLLKRGSKKWNRWREEHTTIRPNFVGLDLTGMDLTEMNLDRIDLGGADLSSATLHRASLRGTNLTRANLREANLSETLLLETIFSNVDLTGAVGLESCTHQGPSTIDHRTLLKSGSLPRSFLRGCGLPDSLIDYVPALLNEPIQFYSCFISYSNRNRDFAERLYADLQSKDVRCWYAPEDMKIGDEFRTRIDESIHVHDRVLLILSEHAIRSQWVQKEVETAFEKEEKEKRLVLFPVRVDDAIMKVDVGWAADIRRQRHIGDFTDWKNHDAYQEAFARLLKDLQAEEQPHAIKLPHT